MSNLENAIIRLSYLFEPASSYTNSTKISTPNDEDPNKQFKCELIERSLLILNTGRARLSGKSVGALKHIEEHIFKEIADLPEFDSERKDYFELANAAENVIEEINATE